MISNQRVLHIHDPPLNALRGTALRLAASLDNATAVRILSSSSSSSILLEL